MPSRFEREIESLGRLENDYSTPIAPCLISRRGGLQHVRRRVYTHATVAAAAPSAAAAALGAAAHAVLSTLAVGAEVDYNVVDALWVPARVEAVSPSGVTLRFAAAGTVELSHVLTSEQAATRVAPAASQSVPMLDGQPVDVLHRTPATESFPASEQWQRGASLLCAARRSPRSLHAALAGEATARRARCTVARAAHHTPSCPHPCFAHPRPALPLRSGVDGLRVLAARCTRRRAQWRWC